MRYTPILALLAGLTGTFGCDSLKDILQREPKAATPQVTVVAPVSAPAPLAPPPEPTAAGAVAIGETVSFGEGKRKADYKVEKLYGKLAFLKRTAKDEWEWVYVRDVTPAGTPLPDPVGDRCSVVLGQRVRPYGDKNWLARVGEVYGNMARVAYTDGTLAWLPCDKCDPVF